jgi:signal peptidase I
MVEKTQDAPMPDKQASGDTGPETEEEAESLGSLLFFMLKLAMLVLVFRSFVFSPFSIPSESMLPRLWNGDYLLAAKWPYGFSKHSLPFSLPLIPGRVFADQPERGDVVIFKHPVDGTDYIKRVIGLPGDSVAMRAGQLILNGQAVPKERIADFAIPVSANTSCDIRAREEVNPEGERMCLYPQFKETLPSGKSYNVLDLGMQFDADNYGPAIVPEGRMFVMGDNRDSSSDSRFEAIAGAGVGFVPQDNLVGRANVVMWSTDGSSEWILPWTWFSAARWSRMFEGI